jgi:hypothetical protein
VATAEVARLPRLGDLRALDRQQALVERRADRARQLMHAAEVVLLGADDDECIRLDFEPDRYSDLPGVRST